MNYAIKAPDKISHDSLDELVFMLLFFMRKGLVADMWKRDISRAFRRLAIAAEHLHLAWVVFLFHGVRWAAQHLAMPFGSISAVHAWHRTGAFLLAAVRRLALAPAARYVDDFFGASRKASTGQEVGA